MSVLQPTTQTPAEEAASQVVAIVLASFKQLRASGMNGYNLIWNNKLATPEEVIAALGTDAVEVFQLAGLNVQTVTEAATISGITAPSIPEVPANYVLTPNTDGSMTVTELASSSSSSSSLSSESSESSESDSSES